MKLLQLAGGMYVVEKGWFFKKRLCLRGSYKGEWIYSFGWQESHYNTTCLGTLEECQKHIPVGYVKPKSIEKLQQYNGELKEEFELLKESLALEEKIRNYKNSKQN